MEWLNLLQPPGNQSIVEPAKRLRAVVRRSGGGKGGTFTEVSVLLSPGVDVRVVVTLMTLPRTNQAGERTKVRTATHLVTGL